MHHDLDLLDRLSAFAVTRYEGEVYRATRRGLDPLAASVAGGRWMVPNEAPTLYTSCERDGALAEISHHWSQLTPFPSKPVLLHKMAVRTAKTIRLDRSQLISLGVEWSTYALSPTLATQKIGAAAAFLEMDGLIAPSARWECENMMLFLNNHSVEETFLSVIASEEVDWREWIKTHTEG